MVEKAEDIVGDEETNNEIKKDYKIQSVIGK